MRGWIRRVLTRWVWVRPHNRRRKLKLEEEPPSEQLILVMEFLIVATVALTVIEVVHIVYLGVWNSEVFAAITGLIGTVTGIIVSNKI